MKTRTQATPSVAPGAVAAMGLLWLVTPAHAEVGAQWQTASHQSAASDRRVIATAHRADGVHASDGVHAGKSGVHASDGGSASMETSTGDGTTAAHEVVPASKPAPPMMILPQRRGVYWDAELEGAIRFADPDDDATLGWGRIQAGLMWVQEPTFVSLTASATLGGASAWSLGGQFEVTHLASGTWLHGGLGWAGKEDAVVASVGAGITIFGVEWQRRLRDGDVPGAQSIDGWYLVMRLPVGIVAAVR